MPKTRTAVRNRRRHIFSKPRKIKYRPAGLPEAGSTQISILHAEDNEPLANLINEMLSVEGWRAELCVDGDSALRNLTTPARIALLLVVNKFPGLMDWYLVEATSTF